MRRLALVGVVLAAALTALPTSARTIRADLNSCGSTLANLDALDPSILYCWGNVPPQIGLQVALPTDNQAATQNDAVIGGQGAPNPNRYFGYYHSQPGEIFNFFINAFDYPKFLIDIGNPNGVGLDEPYVQVTHGLARLNDPSNDNPFEIPLLRINWIIDPDLASYTQIFEPGLGEINGTNYFGVQLIFYGDNPSFAPGLSGYPDQGVGFEINGLVDTKTYTYTTLWWQDDRAPCSSFGNDGQPLCTAASVPEPSTVALFGLGLLALVIGLRTGRPGRMYPA